MKNRLPPTVIYRTIKGNTHVLNYTTGKIMSFKCEKEDVELLIDLRCDGIDVSDDVKKLFVGRKRNLNGKLCKFNLVDLGMEFSFPTTVNLELNQRCNLRCIHCYIESDNIKSNEQSLFDNMTSSQIDALLNSLKSMGVFLITLTGGEPFLNENIKKIVLMAAEKGFIIEILSNLQFIPDWVLNSSPNILKIGRIQTSIYSANPYIHDKITTVKGSFANTVESLRVLKSKGYYLEVATPLMSINFETRNATVAYFRGLEIEQNFAWPIINEYKNSTHKKELLNISFEQVRRFASEHKGFFIKMVTKDKKEPICAAGRATFSIACNGDVWPCSQYPLIVGNIEQEDVAEIACSPVMCEIGKRKKAMIVAKNLVNFCMGVNYSETGNPFLQPDFLKQAGENFKMKGGDKS